MRKSVDNSKQLEKKVEEKLKKPEEKLKKLEEKMKKLEEKMKKLEEKMKKLEEKLKKLEEKLKKLVLIHGPKWLVIEANHDFKNNLIEAFSSRGEFLKRNVAEGWVHKQYPVPTEILLMACSVASFDKSKRYSYDDIIKIVTRIGNSYKIVDN